MRHNPELNRTLTSYRKAAEDGLEAPPRAVFFLLDLADILLDAIARHEADNEKLRHSLSVMSGKYSHALQQLRQMGPFDQAA